MTRKEAAMAPYNGEFNKPVYTLFNDSDGFGGGLFWWRDCKTSGCQNQVCTWLSNTLCHPCTLKSARISASPDALIAMEGEE